MTYRELLAALHDLNDEQLNEDVTINAFDEYFAATLTFADENNDILDYQHPYFAPKYHSDDN